MALERRPYLIGCRKTGELSFTLIWLARPQFHSQLPTAKSDGGKYTSLRLGLGMWQKYHITICFFVFFTKLSWFFVMLVWATAASSAAEHKCYFEECGKPNSCWSSLGLQRFVDVIDYVDCKKISRLAFSASTRRTFARACSYPYLRLFFGHV